ncbi:MAG: 50S ribosomal protein L21 [Anaerolineales bacterium]
MRYAVLMSGGKQYLALEGQALEVDHISTGEGELVEFGEVLLVAEDDRVQVGKPTVSGATVQAHVLSHVRGPKIRVFKYRPKKRTRKRQGHRQELTRLEIDEIRFPGSVPPPQKASAVKPAKKPTVAKKAAEVAEKPAPRRTSATKSPRRSPTPARPRSAPKPSGRAKKTTKK